MANIVLNKAVTPQQQKAITRADLDCAIHYLAEYTLSQRNIFGLSDTFLRYGQPGRTPSGGWGYVVYGTNDLYKKPEPNPLDHRISWRSGEIPVHVVDYGSLYQVESKVTNFVERDRLTLLDPKKWFDYHMKALLKTLPLYYTYLLYSIFASEEKKKLEWNAKKWIKTYIEPDNGTTDGYKMMLSEGYGQINLTPVIAKEKIKENDLKKQLEDISKALRHESRKVEISEQADEDIKTYYKSKELTPKAKKALALYHGIEKFVYSALEIGYLDEKYKHEKTDLEGFFPQSFEKDYVIIMSTDLRYTISKMSRFTTVSQGSYDLQQMNGVQILWTPLLDENEGFCIHRELIYLSIVQSTCRYLIDVYRTDETKDHIYRVGHTISLNKLFPSVWFKLKE